MKLPGSKRALLARCTQLKYVDVRDLGHDSKVLVVDPPRVRFIVRSKRDTPFPLRLLPTPLDANTELLDWLRSLIPWVIHVVQTLLLLHREGVTLALNHALILPRWPPWKTPAWAMLVPITTVPLLLQMTAGSLTRRKAPQQSDCRTEAGAGCPTSCYKKTR